MIGFELLFYDGKKELVTVAKNKEKIRISFVYVELVIIYLNAYYYSSGLPKILCFEDVLSNTIQSELDRFLGNYQKEQEFVGSSLTPNMPHNFFQQ